MHTNRPLQSNPPTGYAATSPTPTDDQPHLFEIRPDPATFWRGVGARALILLPVLALGVYRAAGRNGIGWFTYLYVAVAVVLVFGTVIMLQASSVLLTATTIEKHRRWLRPKVVQRAAVASGVLVPQYRSAFNRTAPLLVLAGSNGRPILRLTGQMFTGPDLYTLAQRFGYGFFDVFEGVTGPKAVAKRHKKLIPLIERRPALLIVVGVVVLLVAVVVGISVFDPTV